MSEPRPQPQPRAGACALRAFETELAVSRLRDLKFIYGRPDTCWCMIAMNPTVTLDVMKALPDKPWSNYIEKNPSFSAADIREFCAWRKTLPKGDDSDGDDDGDDDGYNAPRFSHKKDFTAADMERMTAEDCPDNPMFLNSLRVCFMRDMFGKQNPNMTWEIYQRDYYDDPECLENPAVANARTIRENPTFPWDSEPVNVKMLLRNPAIGVKALAELERLYVGLPFWDWEAYSWSEAVTWEVVVRYWDKGWDMAGLSRNPKVVTWQRLSEWPDGLGKQPGLSSLRQWNWKSLSENPAVATWERICERPELPWSRNNLAINPAVCVWEAIADPPPGQLPKQPRFWKQSDYFPLAIWSKIQFVGDAERAEWAQRWMATWRIQQFWLQLYYTPDTGVWKRRMLRELGDLQGAGGAAPVAALVSAAAAS